MWPLETGFRLVENDLIPRIASEIPMSRPPGLIHVMKSNYFTRKTELKFIVNNLSLAVRGLELLNR